MLMIIWSCSEEDDTDIIAIAGDDSDKDDNIANHDNNARDEGAGDDVI